MIVKTMKSEELQVFMEKLPAYTKHVIENPDSLISKIYGIFTFERNDISGSKTHILLMRNIASCPGEYIERTFDLKGSSFDREALNKKINK